MRTPHSKPGRKQGSGTLALLAALAVGVRNVVDRRCVCVEAVGLCLKMTRNLLVCVKVKAFCFSLRKSSPMVVPSDTLTGVHVATKRPLLESDLRMCAVKEETPRTRQGMFFLQFELLHQRGCVPKCV